MKYPQIIYGTAWKKDRTTELVKLALKQGFRAIDTANQAKHYNEPGVGEALLSAFNDGISREDLFIQTKFTSRNGQDHRLPYDENADLKTQVAQSFESSLQHLHVSYLDSYVLHGPDGFPGLSDDDWEVWGAIEQIFDSGRTKLIGASNMNAMQLQQILKRARVKPHSIQNRCYARTGWDKEVREICRAQGISYQGFSLLTANPEVFQSAAIQQMSKKHHTTIAQLVFRFAVQVGMTPLTGTTNGKHMQEDLAAKDITLSEEEVSLIETEMTIERVKYSV